MHVRFFTIPVHGGEDAAEELNRFLAAHRVLAIDRELIHDGVSSVWAVGVTVVQAESRPQIPKKGAVDYKDVLSQTEFAVFARLRSLRKTLADRDGLPSYALFTNEQLAEMVRRRVTTASGLREIHSVGDARVGKYGAPFRDIMRTEITPDRNRNEPDNRNDNPGFRCARAHGWTGGFVPEQTSLPAVACGMAKPQAAGVVVGSGGAGPDPRQPADRGQRRWSAARCR